MRACASRNFGAINSTKASPRSVVCGGWRFVLQTAAMCELFPAAAGAADDSVSPFALALACVCACVRVRMPFLEVSSSAHLEL